ncbi:MAG: adenosylmethionine decarboxylase [Patescibacteria group bacterium]
MSTLPSRNYGLHLMLDGYGADSKLLHDVSHIFNVLDSLPALIGMRKIGFPHMAKFEESDIAGVSGIIMIMESHISIHTYSLKEFLTADVYSCKEFDTQKAIDYLQASFKIKQSDVQLVKRGVKFPVANVRETAH